MMNLGFSLFALLLTNSATDDFPVVCCYNDNHALSYNTLERLDKICTA